MPTIWANVRDGLIDGNFTPGDRDGLVVALEAILTELRAESGIPAYVEYDEGKIHAGCNIITD